MSGGLNYDFTEVTDHLFDQDGVWFAPIRHHSPACAWALNAMIQDVQPVEILIEAPADYEDLIPLLLHEETRPPVAVVSLIGKTDQRVAGYFPFCAHSPELVALQAGQALGAKLRFIDLASGEKGILKVEKKDRPIVFSSDDHFDSSDYTNALAKSFKCRDGFELWDHLFETRIGTADWRGFFTDVGAYCAGMRASTPPDVIASDGDEKREAFMASRIAEARGKGPVLVVTGGFHTPALIRSLGKTRTASRTAQSSSKSYLIRYSFDALDALNGYAAGLPQPAYYDELWKATIDSRGTPDWKAIGIDIVNRFAERQREQGYPIAVPAQVEMLRIAESLARLRGRPGIMRYDLFDGARAALVKGEANVRDIWTEGLASFLTGSQIGNIPVSAGSPPLVEDARDRARANRIDVSDGGQRRRKLDVYRKGSQLEASRYFHAMTLLDTGFARREAGPDFINRARMDLLFEEWSFAWSPAVEGRLIELSVLGDQLPTVCLNRLFKVREDLEKNGEAGDLPQLVSWLSRGLMAGLGDKLSPFLAELSNDIQTSVDFSATAHCLRNLYSIATTRGVLRPPDILDFDTALDVAFYRLVYLTDDLCQTTYDTMEPRLKALKLATEFLNGAENTRFDAELYNEAIDRVVSSGPPPQILGATLGICVQSGRRPVGTLTEALNGQFDGSVISTEDRIGVLIGLLATVPSVLWSVPEVLDAVDKFLRSLEEDEFISILPALRHAFTALNPRETEKLASQLAFGRKYSVSALTATHWQLSEDDLHLGARAERAMQAAIQADGLDDWLSAEVDE